MDVVTALKEESPYLLFYQIEPIDGLELGEDPPTYAESEARALTSIAANDPTPSDISITEPSTVADESTTTLATSPNIAVGIMDSGEGAAYVLEPVKAR